MKPVSFMTYFSKLLSLNMLFVSLTQKKLICKEKIIKNINAIIVMVPTYKQNYLLVIMFIIQTEVYMEKVCFNMTSFLK